MAMTVEDLSRRSGVPANTVRYYSRIGLLRPARHPSNGYRLYGEADLTRLGFVAKAKWLGLSLSEVATLIRTAEQGASPCRLARRMVERRVVENRGKIDELLALQSRMERALAAWKDLPDREPDGRLLCHLIEEAVPPGAGAWRHDCALGEASPVATP